ncbi:MAG TPA: IS110 family transposase [Acidimicrobiia bacterium]|nr:IS110 family transposase [Acidimicrobiia bacterium]
MMVVLGTDAHKRTHTIVAADQAGAQLGAITVAATSEGHLRALRWAAQWEERRWAIEDCRHLSRALEADLLAAGELVVRVAPKMMAGIRRSARTRGKSDPIDALAVARAALREPGLPVAKLDGPAREVKLLVDYRETLVRERTALQNRLRWRLHELEPGYDPPAGSLDVFRTLEQIEALLEAREGLVADLARRELARIRELTKEANRLEGEIAVRVAKIVPSLLELSGCGALTAAKLVGEAADITRFRSKDAYAMFAGTAPIPVWTSNRERFRLNRGGNRQTNAAIHRIAVTQLRCYPPAQMLVAKHLGHGKTKREALRVLKRRLSDVIQRTMLQDALATTSQAAPTRAA